MSALAQSGQASAVARPERKGEKWRAPAASAPARGAAARA